jgi:hypothetical protein
LRNRSRRHERQHHNIAARGDLPRRRLAVRARLRSRDRGQHQRASKTLALHRRIYAAEAEAGCIIHAHSTHLVAVTLAGAWSPMTSGRPSRRTT